MILLIKASIILIILLAFYKLVLERESFFASNRVYLLACLVLAIVLPYVTLPKLVDHQGYVSDIISIEKSQEILDNHIAKTTSSVTKGDLQMNENQSFSEDVHDDTSKPFAPVENESLSEIKSSDKSSSSLNWLLWLYAFGAIVLSFNLIGQIISTIAKAWKANDKIDDDGYTIVNLEGSVEPCSFFKYIFINPSLYDYDTYEQILAHEKIHVDQKHSWDLLLSELAVIIFWFNPFVWLLRIEIEKNIEYQTDALLLAADEDIKQSYQLNLVDIASKTRPLAITTNYNQSLIKQRILKMNGKRSHKFNYWKYAFLLPLLFVIVLGINKPNELGATTLPNTEVSLLDTLVIENNDKVEDEIHDIADSDPIPNEVDIPKEIYSEKVSIPQEVKDEVIPQLLLNESSAKIFADCKEFEDAVARGDLERVKEILKTIDPDCLKVTKEKIASNKIEQKKITSKNELESKNETSKDVEFDNSVCDRIEDAVANYDNSRTRRILMNEDFGCLKSINGTPTEDTKLVKGLLQYGAKLSISSDKIIHISDVGFEIGLPKVESDCDDPSYLALVEAIKVADREKIRHILSTEDLSCPYNSDGVTNDFPFIKEMMKYGPELLVVNRESVIVHGVGVNIDIYAFDDDRDSAISDASTNDYKYKQALSEIERLMMNYNVPQDNDCLQLLNAVERGDISDAEALLSGMTTDCYHKITETTTSPHGSSSITHTLTPLILAAAHGDHNMVRLMLNNNADVNYQGDGAETALMYGVQSSKLSIVKLLLDEGAKINVSDDKGYSALDYAEGFGYKDIIQFLKSKGAKSGGREEAMKRR